VYGTVVAAEAKFGAVQMKKAAIAELKQIHMRNTFDPKHWDWSELTPKQKEEVLEAFMFVEQKKSSDDKGRLVINGKVQHGHITKEEASLPTASTDAILLTLVVNGSVLTVCFHVDDCKISHKSKKVVNETIEWVRDEYEVIFKDSTGAIKVHRGTVHKYLCKETDEQLL
jgi:riboflavin synthase